MQEKKERRGERNRGEMKTEEERDGKRGRGLRKGRRIQRRRYAQTERASALSEED